jgi:hypothetical protein
MFADTRCMPLSTPIRVSSTSFDAFGVPRAVQELVLESGKSQKA